MALVRLLPCVDTRLDSQVGGLNKGLVAQDALEGSLSCVCPLLEVKVRPVKKALLAFSTLKPSLASKTVNLLYRLWVSRLKISSL